MDQTVIGMCCSGIVVFIIGVASAKKEIVKFRGLEKVASVSNICFAVPLAVFGALHLFGPQFVMNIVPDFMPWRMFWVYFVGCALIGTSLSVATDIGVSLSGLLFGIMMFLFVAMIHLPGALSDPHNRIIVTIVFREISFGGAGWIIAGNAMSSSRRKKGIIIAGSIFVMMALVIFGIEHFLHPLGLPGVPLKKEMPEWIPGRAIIDYATGAALLVTAVSVPFIRKMRIVAISTGGWIISLVVVIYGPMLITALLQHDNGVQIEGINYFADTLLFAGVILALAKEEK